jgi:hypothetical protein
VAIQIVVPTVTPQGFATARSVEISLRSVDDKISYNDLMLIGVLK